MITAFDVKLVPIKLVQGHELSPAVTLDPYFLFEAYSPAQFLTALSIFPLAKTEGRCCNIVRPIRELGIYERNAWGGSFLTGSLGDHFTL